MVKIFSKTKNTVLWKMMNEYILDGPVSTNLSLELLHNVPEKVLVKVLSTQECISICRFHFENPLLDLQD